MANSHHRVGGSTPTTDPEGTRDATSPVIFRCRSRRRDPFGSGHPEPSTSPAIACCRPAIRSYSAAFHSVMMAPRHAIPPLKWEWLRVRGEAIGIAGATPRPSCSATGQFAPVSAGTVVGWADAMGAEVLSTETTALMAAAVERAAERLRAGGG